MDSKSSTEGGGEETKKGRRGKRGKEGKERGDGKEEGRGKGGEKKLKK